MPQLVAQFPEMIAIMAGMKLMTLTMHSTMSGIGSQMDDMGRDATAMGQLWTPPRTTIRSTFRRRSSRTRTSSER